MQIEGVSAQNQERFDHYIECLDRLLARKGWAATDPPSTGDELDLQADSWNLSDKVGEDRAMPILAAYKLWVETEFFHHCQERDEEAWPGPCGLKDFDPEKKEFRVTGRSKEVLERNSFIWRLHHAGRSRPEIKKALEDRYPTYSNHWKPIERAGIPPVNNKDESSQNA